MLPLRGGVCNAPKINNLLLIFAENTLFIIFIFLREKKTFVMNYSLLIKAIEGDKSIITVEECLLTHTRKTQVAGATE